MSIRSRRRGRALRVAPSESKEDIFSPVWPGLIGGAFRPLNDQALADVNEAVLHLLEALGLSQASPSMIEKVCAQGGTFTEDGRLQFPRELVLRAVSGARRDIVLYGQNSSTI